MAVIIGMLDEGIECVLPESACCDDFGQIVVQSFEAADGQSMRVSVVLEHTGGRVEHKVFTAEIHSVVSVCNIGHWREPEQWLLERVMTCLTGGTLVEG